MDVGWWRELKQGQAGALPLPARARRRRSGVSRRTTTRPSVLRRIGRIAWVSPRHAALALATGLACGALASRVDRMVSPPNAAIVGAAVFHPALITIWRRVPRPGSRRR